MLHLLQSSVVFKWKSCKIISKATGRFHKLHIDLKYPTKGAELMLNHFDPNPNITLSANPNIAFSKPYRNYTFIDRQCIGQPELIVPNQT